MALSVREYRARIKSTESMKKITRAMELIAASRIIKAQQRAQQAAPYARELTRAVSALVTYSDFEVRAGDYVLPIEDIIDPPDAATVQATLRRCGVGEGSRVVVY